MWLWLSIVSWIASRKVISVFFCFFYWVIVLKEEEKPEPVDSSRCDAHLLASLRTHGDGGGDDEELRMLASLKREQEEDEHTASGLRASQIHRCNISISSDDASTWTHVSVVRAYCTVYTLPCCCCVVNRQHIHMHLNYKLQSLVGSPSFCLGLK